MPVFPAETTLVSEGSQLVAVAPNRSLTDAAKNRGVRVYRLRDATEVAWIAKPEEDYFVLHFSDDHNYLYAVDSDGQILRCSLK